MTVGYRVEADTESLQDAISYFEFVGGNTSDAMRIAINKTGRPVRTRSSQKIREQVRLKAGYVNERLKFVKATRRKLEGRIQAPSRGLLLSRYSTKPLISGDRVSWIKPPPVPPRGIRVKVKPSGSPKTVTGGPKIDGKPFYLVLRNGRLAIAGRRRSAGPQGGTLDVLHAPSLSQVFTDVKDDVSPFASEKLTDELVKAMNFVLKRKFPPAGE